MNRQTACDHDDRWSYENIQSDASSWHGWADVVDLCAECRDHAESCGAILLETVDAS
jgi:hypothetical protein